MKRYRGSLTLLISAFVICLSSLGGMIAHGGATRQVDEETSANIVPEPVDRDMHHFMEYVFQPNYKRLKADMTSAPQNADTWKAIKGDSLTLAEGANLLLMRTPDEGSGPWRRFSAQVRAHGSELYQAARRSDYPASRKAYLLMLQSCNACHERFAGGEHLLEP